LTAILRYALQRNGRRPPIQNSCQRTCPLLSCSPPSSNKGDTAGSTTNKGDRTLDTVTHQPLPSQGTTIPQPTSPHRLLPRRNPSCHAPREPLNISSVSGQSYDKPKSTSHYASAFAAALALSSASTTQLFHHQLTGLDSYTGLQEYMHPATLQSPFYLANPMALKAKKAPYLDIPSTREALTGPHAEQHWTSMSAEIESLESKRTWDVVLRSSMPKGIKATPGTRCHRIKRHPDGSLNKFKA
jgi:hypothetical protein